jgi:hypothetical protein
LSHTSFLSINQQQSVIDASIILKFPKNSGKSGLTKKGRDYSPCGYGRHVSYASNGEREPEAVMVTDAETVAAQ